MDSNNTFIYYLFIIFLDISSIFFLTTNFFFHCLSNQACLGLVKPSNPTDFGLSVGCWV
jgi:hypothetical protein